ncbi:MAG: GNAT family N-acetyltransferase [Alphaproteobacteria bacterium]|nr:GNAT family N-acetyltransferase [Alphaproteobacteria bacterium]
MPVTLVKPALPHLASYHAALVQGWSPDNLRPQVAQEELAKIDTDAVAFLADLDQFTGQAALPDMTGATVTLPDGSQVARLPGFRRWIWDGTFCGSIGMRWQPGTASLPPHVLGHIGYAVVPWKRQKGYATAALQQLLPLAQAYGLPYVELTTEPANIASQKVITNNGGVLVETFTALPAYGSVTKLRYRIVLSPAANERTA